ncbi:MAG: DUF3148 domain-containing protein [Elainellaceae cyanobacterium]
MSDEQHHDSESPGIDVQVSLSVGDRVRISTLPPYVKTAETMPMLRPSHVVQMGEEGTVIDYRPGNHWSVRFEGGTFLIDSQYLEKV